MIQSPKLPRIQNSGKLHFSANHAEIPERGGASQYHLQLAALLTQPAAAGSRHP
jgi:hypothetical protein